MIPAWIKNPGFFLLAVALLVVVIPAVSVIDAAAEECCPAEDPCCPDTESEDCDSSEERDCCPGDCSVCLRTCCASPASLLAPPVMLDGSEESNDASPSRCVDSSTLRAHGIYHPPQI